MADVTHDVREAVRARYAAAAIATTGGGSCCGGDPAVVTDEQADSFGHGLYADDDRAELGQKMLSS